MSLFKSATRPEFFSKLSVFSDELVKSQELLELFLSPSRATRTSILWLRTLLVGPIDSTSWTCDVLFDGTAILSLLPRMVRGDVTVADEASAILKVSLERWLQRYLSFPGATPLERYRECLKHAAAAAAAYIPDVWFAAGKLVEHFFEMVCKNQGATLF